MFDFCDIIDSHLTRKVPASYSDGVYMIAGTNRPNPRKLSQLFMKGEDGLGSILNRTTIFAFFGEQLDFIDRTDYDTVFIKDYMLGFCQDSHGPVKLFSFFMTPN